VKHSVDVVIDRLRARADTKQRLAESFETALRHADGRALVVEQIRIRSIFLGKFSCPLCDYALPELEPRLFSFNNPDGRLPALRRPGRDRVLRPEARRRASESVAGERRDPRLGP